MAIWRRVGNLFRRGAVEREIEKELATHIALRTEDNIAAGMSPEQARRDALIRFGNPVVMQERTAAADEALLLESIRTDVGYAFRQLRRAPGFALTSILILSLGIGAVTAIFSAVKPILLDPLPYPQASRIMMLSEMRSDDAPRRPSFGTFRGLVERSSSFDAMAVMKAWQPVMTAINEKDHPERLEGQRVSAAYFQVLGIAPRIGRDFEPMEDVSHGPNAVILSDRLWRRRFAADEAIVGKQVRLDDGMFTVVGVMPGGFENVLSPSAELWTTLQYDAALPWDGREWGHHLRMFGRLRAGVTSIQAANELSMHLGLMASIYTKGYSSSGGAPSGMIVHALQSDLTEEVRPALLAVLGAVLLVLLIACVNVANLLLARGVQRRSEFAMRSALGASRVRIVRQLLTESLLLALLGGALGLGVAQAGVRALVALSPPELPRVNAIGVDGGVFLFALGVAAIVGIVVGLAPALQTSQTNLHVGMQQSSRRTAGGRYRMRGLLVIAEVSIAVVLLVSAGLLLRTMQRLFAVDPGFDGSHLLTMQIQESGQRFDNDTVRMLLFTQALERIRQVPGVLSADLTDQLPLTEDYDVYGVQIQRDNRPDSAGPVGGALRYAVTPGYFQTMRIPLKRGRVLNERDIVGAPVVVVISEALASHRFAGVDPVGQHVRMGPDAGHADKPWATVVGVVGNVKQQSLALGDEDAFYIATAQWNWVDTVQSLVVRTQGPAAAMAPAIREAIWSVDKDQAIVRVATMDSLLAASEAKRHFVLMLFEAFALAGLVLAATGIYGVLSGSVTERTREIGVRAALGASRGNILGLVIRQGMALTTVGVLVGLCGAVAASRGLASLLFGVSRFDPITYAGVAVLLVLASGVACFLPALRAVSVDPVEALRAE